MLFNSNPTLAQALGLLFTIIIALVALSLPVVLIEHALDVDISEHPLVLGIVNCLAIGYVVHQSIVRISGTFHQILPLRPVDSRLFLPMLSALAGAAILISELYNIIVTVYPIPEELAKPLIDLATGEYGWFSTIFLLNIVAPITEEALFRGILLTGFLANYGPKRAVLLSSLLFACFHFNPWQGIGAFILGILFGWWFVQTRSLLPCLVGHAVFNAIPVVVYGLLGDEPPEISGVVEFQPLWLDGLGTLLLTGGCLILHKSFQASMPVPKAEWTRRAILFSRKLLDYARDEYGRTHTPLFASQIDTRTGRVPDAETKLYWTASRGGAGPTTNNLQFDGGLLRLMYGLTDYTGDPEYGAAADEYLTHYLRELPLPSGYFPWGDHRGYDVLEDDVVDGHGEFKVTMPVWDRLWAIDPEAVVRQADALRRHIIDPERSLAFDRHYPPSEMPHCMNSSAGAWILLWSFLYTRTGERNYIEWATEMAEYVWSLRNPATDLLAAHPLDPAYPEQVSDPVNVRRASRTEYLGPMYWYATNLLRTHRLLGGESRLPFGRQALSLMRAFTTRFNPTDEGHFFATFEISSGEPLFDRIEEGWQFTPQSSTGESASGVVGLRAPISLAYAYLLTDEDDFKMAFDGLSPLFRLDRFFDLDAPRQQISAGLLAQAIGAWTNLYTATMGYRYLSTAITLAQYAVRHYVSDDWFVCGPPTVPRYRDTILTGWETYSNRGGSSDLAVALLRLSAISDGRFELIDHDPLCYF